VLVDSEPIAAEVMSRALEEYGWKISPEECMERFLGRTMKACQGLIELQMGRKVADTFLDDLQKSTFDAFKSSLKPIPGIVEALEQIQIPSCVASSGGHEKILFTLTHTGLHPKFEGRIFSATEVAHGKPAPDLFLHAASKMKTHPSACVVVEDSPLGVQAAKAAGMRVLGYAPDPARARRLESEGAIVFNHMAKLPELILS
jgi:HAD superfamily hydrolase (TIGR01509 family)